MSQKFWKFAPVNGGSTKYKIKIIQSTGYCYSFSPKSWWRCSGSTVALVCFLKREIMRLKIIYPSEYPTVFQYLIDDQTLRLSMIWPPAKHRGHKNASVIFLLDFNALDRIDKMGKPCFFQNAMKVLIDHHIDPETNCRLYFIRHCGQFNFRDGLSVYQRHGYGRQIRHFYRRGTFTGLITDTGSFPL